MNVLWKLVSSLLVTFGTAYAGSMITTPAISGWYQTIIKPAFTPPNWLFGPVWSLLYLFMAIALFLVWNSNAKKEVKKQALTVYFAQLVLNFFWSVAFFGLQQPLLGLIVILVLWALILKTIQYFLPINKTAGYLLYPYLAWVSFATILNFSIAVLNF